MIHPSIRRSKRQREPINREEKSEMSTKNELLNVLDVINQALTQDNTSAAHSILNQLIHDVRDDKFLIAKEKLTQRSLFTISDIENPQAPTQIEIIAPARLTEQKIEEENAEEELPSWAAGLIHFTGTENYYKSLLGKMLHTDGVEFLAEQAGAYWLVDLVASYLHKKSIRQELSNGGMCFWDLTVNADHSAVVTCRRDSGDKPWVRQEIPMTDFPLKSIKLYLAAGGPDGLPVLMLPTEY
jgi:hypothetical protein